MLNTMQFQTEMNSNSEFQRKRQAIHHALRTVLSSEEAASAVISWEQFISPSASAFNGLNQFARQVCELYGKHGRHTELVQAMIKALVEGGASRHEEETATERRMPAEEIAATEAVHASPEIRTAEFSSFQVLLQALLQEIDRLGAGMGESCRQFLLNALENLPWSPEQQLQVASLVNTGVAVQTRPYRAGQLVSLMHHLSLWMQDMLGAETAARLMRNAMARAEKSAAATAYPPQGFMNG